MKKFKYKAKLKGKKQKGEVDAETIVLAKQKLRADGYRFLRVRDLLALQAP